MRIAFVGCGYVFDIYMRTRWAHPELEIAGVFDIDTHRSSIVQKFYGLHVYDTLDDLLADRSIETIVNLTSIRSHGAVIKAALEAGKHVYSEKPFTLHVDETEKLFDLAASLKLVLSGAPCNLFSDAIVTISKALNDGAIGKPLLVYAELDDNPAHLMGLESVRSPTGAPFPVAEELQEGCTVEHATYHLSWMCALFGAVQSLVAFSHCLVKDKTELPLSPPDTPDLSVACLTFANDVTARLTCSWVAPRDHSFRIVGDQGQISCDNIFHDQSPVRLERFSKVSLTARKSYALRKSPALGRMFGIGGRRIPLQRGWKSFAVEADHAAGRTLKQRLVSEARRRQIYAQDKFLGIAEMARAMREGRPQALQADLLLHLNELTLAIARAGAKGITMTPATTFVHDGSILDRADQANAIDHSAYRNSFLERRLEPVMRALHRQ